MENSYSGMEKTMTEHMSIDEYKKRNKGSKYHNQRTEYNGEMYDSKKEADYARRLQFLKHAKKLEDRVIDIERQVPFTITVGKRGKAVATYFADFRVTYGDLRQEVIDVKGVRTGVYILKKKLVEEIHQIKIIEV